MQAIKSPQNMFNIILRQETVLLGVSNLNGCVPSRRLFAANSNGQSSVKGINDARNCTAISSSTSRLIPLQHKAAIDGQHLAVSLVPRISSNCHLEWRSRLVGTRSLGEQYDAISGITAIKGPNAIATLILPILTT
jgi:hypothetical protein